MRGMTGAGGLPAMPPERILQMMENPQVQNALHI